MTTEWTEPKLDDILLPAFSTEDSTWLLIVIRDGEIIGKFAPERSFEDVRYAAEHTNLRLQKGWRP